MEVQMPEIKVSQTVIYGIAIGAGILAIVLFYENSKMRKELMNQVTTKKPCGCKETNQPIVTEEMVKEAARLNAQPMPPQHPDDPNHPPEVVL